MLANLYFHPVTSSSLSEALLYSLSFLSLILIFEVSSIEDVKKLWTKKNGRQLHIAALRANMLHHLILGPMTYHITITYICDLGPFTPLQQGRKVLHFLMVEGLLYYLVHRAFHEISSLYWMHRFHHKFNVVVLPSSANAVSPMEYIFAYMLPLSVAAWASSCDKCSTLIATTMVGVANLYIHTPRLEQKMSFLPWIFVTPADHLNHHKQSRMDYGAPIFSFDRMIRALDKQIWN